MALLTGIILLVIGLIACFFGGRFYRVVLALAGFVIGFYLASAALLQQTEIVQIIGATVVGLIVAFIFWSLYKTAHVLFGAFFGMAVGVMLANALNLEGAVFSIFLLVFAVVGALIGLRIADLMIRLGTAFGGASQAVSGLAAIAASVGVSLPLIDPSHTVVSPATSTSAIVTIALMVALGVVGFLFQSRHETA